ncbi:MAG TPA: hypothetical protein GX525_05800, partial [Bacilli bacterium]|nr:hypothetical protein [Bacilli bacterium]
MTVEKSQREIAQDLGESIIELYESRVFGKVSKPEIDIVVFASLFKKYFIEEKPNSKAFDKHKNQIKWHYINPEEISEMSRRLKVKPSTISSKIQSHGRLIYL